jgi:hypothetical protein
MTPKSPTVTQDVALAHPIALSQDAVPLERRAHAAPPYVVPRIVPPSPTA